MATGTGPAVVRVASRQKRSGGALRWPWSDFRGRAGVEGMGRIGTGALSRGVLGSGGPAGRAAGVAAGSVALGRAAAVAAGSVDTADHRRAGAGFLGNVGNSGNSPGQRGCGWIGCYRNIGNMILGRVGCYRCSGNTVQLDKALKCGVTDVPAVTAEGW